MRMLVQVAAELCEMATHYPHRATRLAILIAAKTLIEHEIDCIDEESRLPNEVSAIRREMR